MIQYEWQDGHIWSQHARSVIIEDTEMIDGKMNCQHF